MKTRLIDLDTDYADVAKWWEALVPCFCRSFGTLFEDIYEDASELEHDVAGTVLEVAEKMDAIREKRGAKALGYAKAARELEDDRRADAE